jgi:hypothetical protein
VVNVQEINVYRNVSARNSVVVVKEDHFGRGPITTARVTQVDAKNLKPIHTEPRVTATPASFAPREKRGISPPKEVLARSVVATRPPQARAESASGKGKERDAAPIQFVTPAPRIVSAPQQRETAPVQQRPPYGQSNVERGTSDRAQAPVPPKTESPQVREKASEGVPSAPPRAQQQRESQAVRPSPAKPQPPSPQAASGPTKAPAPPKTESPQVREKASERAPSAPPQAQQQRESQTVRPSPAKPQPPDRQTEAKAPTAQVLPGEPANRLSPNRAERKQSMERVQEPAQMAPRSMPQNMPRGRQSD